MLTWYVFDHLTCLLFVSPDPVTRTLPTELRKHGSTKLVNWNSIIGACSGLCPNLNFRLMVEEQQVVSFFFLIFISTFSIIFSHIFIMIDLLACCLSFHIEMHREEMRKLLLRYCNTTFRRYIIWIEKGVIGCLVDLGSDRHFRLRHIDYIFINNFSLQ